MGEMRVNTKLGGNAATSGSGLEYPLIFRLGLDSHGKAT